MNGSWFSSPLTCWFTALVFSALGMSGCDSPPRTKNDVSSAADRPSESSSNTQDPGIQFPFADITDQSGVDFTHDNGAAGRHHYPENMGPGVALFDADGDGDLDLYAVNGGPLPGTPLRPAVNHFYRNHGDGTFEDITATSGADDDGYGMGVAVGDIDGDSDLDLYVLNYGPNALYVNHGDGTFEKIEAGVEDPSWSVSGAFFDADQDGDLDLYVANYLDYDVNTADSCRAGTLDIYCSPEQFPAAADRLYRNDGGHFVDISNQFGVEVNGRGMGVIAADLDDDGDQDLYVTNDRSPNFLYRNEGGRLQDVAAESGVGYGPTGLAEGGMGVTVADFLNSGKSSIFLTNFQKEPNRLYVPSGAGFYDDMAHRIGVGFSSTEMIGWGIGAYDLEGDGDIDLTIANGHVFENAEEFIPGSSWGLANQFFLHEKIGDNDKFVPMRFPGPSLSSRGLVWGDIDGDGDGDLVVASCGDTVKVFRNDAGDPDRFLLLRLRANRPNTHAVGSRIDIITKERTTRHQVTGGGSYASAPDDRLYLGLGESAAAQRLEVRWPDGAVETLTDLQGGREVIWSQGRGVVAERSLISGTALPEPTP